MALKLIILKILVIFTLSAVAQNYPYPRNYFRNPLDIPIDLSANFGELRKDHWHMGLDIRTRQKENYRVYAAAAGYISEIGIRPQSFGRFIVINHPNGLSTLYAHLNDFFPDLENYVTEKQYQQESWAVELQFQPQQFPLSKGQFIAYSGNTGGSQGPHLHFEIFDTRTSKRLNPLLFDFGVRDEVPPTVVKLAMYDRSRTMYGQSPVLYNLKKTDSGYILPKDAIIKTGLRKVSFAVQATDRLSGTDNPNGIFSAKLFFDDEAMAGFVIDSIDYDETLYMNSHIDYGYKANGGVYLQQLSKLPGDRGSAFRSYTNDGVIDLIDTNLHRVRIDIRDAHGNSSVVLFNIQYSDSFSLGSRQPLAGNRPIAAPNQHYSFRKNGFEVEIPGGALYDSIQLYYLVTKGSQANAISDIHQLNDASIPLHKEISVRIRPDREIPEGWKNRLLIQRTGKGSTIRYSKLENGWVSGSFGDFGKFQVVADIIPPSLNSLGKADTINLSSSSRIVFTPSDNFGIVKKFRAELDGKWLRFTNDKSRSWIYKFDERWSYGIHQLTVTVEDHAGNITTKSWWIKRHPYTPPPPKKKTTKKKKRSR